MCRTGGRRCPSSTDPAHIAEYNAKRRQRYAAKAGSKPSAASSLQALFQPIDEPRFNVLFDQAAMDRFKEETELFRSAITKPEYEVFDTYDDNFDPTNSEQEALMSYTENGYRNVRDYLLDHGGQVEPGSHADKVISLLDSALRQATPPEEPRMLYRGMAVPRDVKNENVTQWIADKFPVGGVVSQHNYMSTSLSSSTPIGFLGLQSAEEENRRVVMEIVSKKGAPLGDNVSVHGVSESEILIPRDARFKVAAVHSKVDYVYDAGLGDAYELTVIQLVDAEEEEK
jgi:hypothetical protein